MIRRFVNLALIFLLCTNTVFADTIFRKLPKDKEEQVLAKDVIVRNVDKDNQGAIREVNFYYWHTKKEILIEVRDMCEQGEILRVEYSSEQERERLISSILRKGIHARVIDVLGSVSEFFCLKADYHPNYALGLWPDDDTILHLKVRQTDETKLRRFSDLATVEFTGKRTVKVLMKDGTLLEGIWVGPYFSLFRDRVEVCYIEGLDNRGKKIAKSLDDVSKIEFIPTTQEKTDVFNMVCPKCSRQYTDKEWKFCPYDGTPLELQTIKSGMESMPAEEPPKEPQTIAGKTLTVSYEYADWSLPFIVALDKGYFTKHGVNIKPRKLEGSPTLDISEVDVINGHGFYVLKKEGFESTTLKFTHPFAMKKDGDMVKGLLVKKSVGIKTWTDFKHKGIVISSSSDMDLLKKVFESNGLTVFGDNADIPSFRTGGGAIAGFPEDKDADAIYGWAMYIRKFQEEKPDAYFLFAQNLECEYIADPYFMGCTYINMKSFGANPTAFRKYLKAIDEAIDFIRQYPKEALAVLPKYFGWEPNEAARFGVYHFYKSTEKPDFEALKKSEDKDLREFFL